MTEKSGVGDAAEQPSSASGSSYPSIAKVLEKAPWASLEQHLDDLTERVDRSVSAARHLRKRYREELLERDPTLRDKIVRPSESALTAAVGLLQTGHVAASDGTVVGVPLMGGSDLQVAVVIVFNTGEVVDFVTKVFEYELNSGAKTGIEYFAQLKRTRRISNLVSRAIMLFGERKLLIEHPADWRLIHGELVPHELRTGAGRPKENLPPTFDLIHKYVQTETFLAVSESSDDLDVLNAGVLLEPGEYIVVRSLEDDLELFLEGDETTGTQRANFAEDDRRRFRRFIEEAGPLVTIVLAKAGNRPFLLECHKDKVEEAVSLFMADSLWTKGLPLDGSAFTSRGFPFHIDLADQVARTLFKGADFRDFVEARVMSLGVDEGIVEIDARRTR